jgi:predicted nucleic-acid-binding Zn-ribbon protein
MSSTNCPKCGHSTFKTQEITPRGSNFKFLSVQCTSCNSPIGLLDYYNTGAQLIAQEKQIKDIQSQLAVIHNMVATIGNVLSRR